MIKIFKRLTKEEKEKRAQYHKMWKIHKKNILALAKKAANDPFDGEMGLYVMVEHLKFMKDYYQIGYNVWAAEAEGIPTRLQSLTAALEEYDLAYDEDDCLSLKYFKKKEYDNGWILPDYQQPLDPNLSFKEAWDKMNEEMMDHRKKFFVLLRKYMPTWWD